MFGVSTARIIQAKFMDPIDSAKEIMQPKRGLLISKAWIQAVVVVGLCGFLLLGILAYRTYTDEPPIPSKVLRSNGELLFTGQDVLAGQEVFLKNGLMETGRSPVE